MVAYKLLTLSFLLNSVIANWYEYTFDYFKRKEVRVITGVFCGNEDAIMISKLFSNYGLGMNVIHPFNDFYLKKWLNSSSSREGVVVDGRCDFTLKIVQMASENRQMDVTKHWLIYTEKNYTLTELEIAAKKWKPNKLDVHNFLTDGKDDFGDDKLGQYNKELNADIMGVENNQGTEISEVAEGEDWALKLFVTINAGVDSEVTLAVPDTYFESFSLYEVYRFSKFTELLVYKIGYMQEEKVTLTKQNLFASSTTYRTNYNGTLLRAMCVLLNANYFSLDGELTSEEHDRVALTTVQEFLLIEKMLNFRAVIKCIDDYGWHDNGSYTGLAKIMFDQDTDLMSQGLLLTANRFPVSDYVGYFNEIRPMVVVGSRTNTTQPDPDIMLFRLGLIFRQPSLPSVTNIFVLPFATDVWFCTGGLLLTCTILLYGQLVSTKNANGVQYWDIVMYFTGAVCQQGTEIPVKTASVRLTMLVFLISSIFLFTSYSATIVALLQSPSDFVKSVKDVVDSSFDIGVQDEPYLRATLRDDTTPVIMQMKMEKLKELGEKAYVYPYEGVRKVQLGMFAFQCDFVDAHRVIGEIFDDIEKCDLKQLQDFQGHFIGPAVPKKSPYREILRQKYLVLRENGFNRRAYKRWTPIKPVCENKGGRFASVGIIDVSPLFLLLVYGGGGALIVLCLEALLFCFKTHGKKSAKIQKEGWEGLDDTKLAPANFKEEFSQFTYTN